MCQALEPLSFSLPPLISSLPERAVLEVLSCEEPQSNCSYKPAGWQYLGHLGYRNGSRTGKRYSLSCKSLVKIISNFRHCLCYKLDLKCPPIFSVFLFRVPVLKWVVLPCHRHLPWCAASQQAQTIMDWNPQNWTKINFYFFTFFTFYKSIALFCHNNRKLTNTIAMPKTVSGT